jgi:Nickel responsive protein SCO4226-like
MKRYVIERHIPGIGSLSQAQLKALAATSNGAVAKLAGTVQWVQSYIAADNTFCIYLAESEERVREHSRLAGFPITRVNETVTVIDPLTAHS